MKTPILALVLTLATTAHAASLRCGDNLVGDGDAMAIVSSKCGAPMSKETRTELVPTPNDPKCKSAECKRGVMRTIDTWIYNFGPGKFMQQLVFVNGVLKEVTPLDYGK